MKIKENPASLAGENGADEFNKDYGPQHYRKRAVAATDLFEAISECHPKDACTIMEAALVSLKNGPPLLRVTRLRHRYGLTFSQAATLALLIFGGLHDDRN